MHFRTCVGLWYYVIHCFCEVAGLFLKGHWARLLPRCPLITADDFEALAQCLGEGFSYMGPFLHCSGVSAAAFAPCAAVLPHVSSSVPSTHRVTYWRWPRSAASEDLMRGSAYGILLTLLDALQELCDIYLCPLSFSSVALTSQSWSTHMFTPLPSLTPILSTPSYASPFPSSHSSVHVRVSVLLLLMPFPVLSGDRYCLWGQVLPRRLARG